MKRRRTNVFEKPPAGNGYSGCGFCAGRGCLAGEGELRKAMVAQGKVASIQQAEAWNATPMTDSGPQNSAERRPEFELIPLAQGLPVKVKASPTNPYGGTTPRA